MATKMIELPEASGRKVFVNPSRVQAVEQFTDRVIVIMNIPGLMYSYYDGQRYAVIETLTTAGVLPGGPPLPTPIPPKPTGGK